MLFPHMFNNLIDLQYCYMSAENSPWYIKAQFKPILENHDLTLNYSRQKPILHNDPTPHK